MARNRDYKAEYQRRNQLAQQRGFKNYGQQRRYTEYTGAPARYVVAPPILPYYAVYNIENYWQGEDNNLDIFMRMARYKSAMTEEEAYDTYMRRGRGRQLSTGELKRLEMDAFDIGEDETWYE